MATNAMVNAPCNLPMPMATEIERMGYSLLRGLDRLGFIHEDKNGDTFTVRFSNVMLYGEAWAAFSVDAERLWHFSVADLSKPSVLAQLSAVARKPVRAVTDVGLTYAVELQPKQRAKLPSVAPLDLGARPTGDLMVPLGISQRGSRWEPLPCIGHAMIAGTTGSGKSTFVHSALASLLTSCGPDRLHLVLIDPKRHELTAWGNVPHLRGKIAVTPDQSLEALADLCKEVDRRGDLLAGVLVRDLEAYNRQVAEPLPFILCVCDEVLDLTDNRDAVDALKTIARRGRSVGVILWALTQHAAAIGGMPRVLNVNLGTRFVFRVADQSAAQIAGCPGAETISPTAHGRFYAKIDTAPEILQGFYLSDESLDKVTRNWRGAAGEPTAIPVGMALLSANAKRLVKWSVSHPEEYRGGMQQHRLIQAFDCPEPADGAGRITSRQVRECLAWLKRQKYLEQRPGLGTTYFMSSALIELAQGALVAPAANG